MSYTPDHQNHTADPSFRERIAQGTEDLTEEARTRVIAARERAIAAGREMNRQAHHAQDRSIDLFERQPLIVGAIAFAIGAAIGAALPRTRLEDSTFGATRDDLVAEAERIYEEEKIRARAAIKEAGSEAQQALTPPIPRIEKGPLFAERPFFMFGECRHAQVSQAISVS
ncbi:MAG: hypothetical protein LC676_12935 [Loktanella sp.]|nr:hypothetical protein [Loktanella sp.]